MKTEPAKGCLRIVVTEFLPITISIVSLFLSSFNLYVNYLKSPDLHFVVAPYTNQVIDERSRNEACFIPLTVINRGARPGTILSFDLTVTRAADKKQVEHFAQYYGQQASAAAVGEFFTPVSLNGYSSASWTVWFYPSGARAEKIFSQPGDYEFRVTAISANAQSGSQKKVIQTIHVSLTDDMAAVMQANPIGQYPYPIPAGAPVSP